MVTFAFRLSLAIAVLGSMACASAGVEEEGTQASRYMRDVGVGTASDIPKEVDLLSRKYLFNIYRYESEPNIYLESRWKGRVPFDDERAEGVDEARTRLIIRARPRQRAAGEVELFSVQVILENMVRLEGSNEWTYRPITEEFRKFAERIASDLEIQLRTGIRIS